MEQTGQPAPRGATTAARQVSAGTGTGAAPGRGGLSNLAPSDPARVGPYTLLARLGAGGMGTVYLAVDGAGRNVAVKVIRAELARVAEFRAGLLREAESARRVARFCTATVIDVNTLADPPYLVVEYVDGPTLADTVWNRGPLSHAELHQLAVSVATALMAIHRAGIVHRDLNPSNILLSRLGPKIIDFGIARAWDGVSMLTGDRPVGTPAFMAPEQAQGHPVTSAADVFAWGGVVVFAGSSRLPFGRGPAAGLLHRTVHEPPDLGSLDASLRPLVEAAMRKNPAERPTAEELYMRLLDLRPDGAGGADGAGGRPPGGGGVPARPPAAESATRYRGASAMRTMPGHVGFPPWVTSGSWATTPLDRIDEDQLERTQPGGFGHGHSSDRGRDHGHGRQPAQQRAGPRDMPAAADCDDTLVTLDPVKVAKTTGRGNRCATVPPVSGSPRIVRNRRRPAGRRRFLVPIIVVVAAAVMTFLFVQVAAEGSSQAADRVPSGADAAHPVGGPDPARPAAPRSYTHPVPTVAFSLLVKTTLLSGGDARTAPSAQVPSS